jgi:transcriptional regulator with XRE-family HTH domain
MEEIEVRELLLGKITESGMNQSEVAKKLDISPQYLNDVLRGNRKPSERILTYLGLKRDIVPAEVKARKRR